MDEHDIILDTKQEIKSSKLKRNDSNGSKKSPGFSKFTSKVTRKRSLKGKNKKNQQVSNDQVFSSTAEPTSRSEAPRSLTNSGGHCSPPVTTPTLVPLSKSISKSEDSLDSGIYSRQKSCDSVDSLGSTGSSGNGAEIQTNSVMSYATAEPPTSTDERVNSPTNVGQYDDFWREYQDIRQSIIVQPDDDVEEKRSVARTDSGDDDDEGDWLRQAGLADLVASAPFAQAASSGTSQAASSMTRLSTDSLTSMTILSTLTRPQREAVLRRITSFNRAQKSKRRPKPHISAVFPDATQDGKSSHEGEASKPPIAPPTVEVTLGNCTTADGSRNKSISLPHDITDFPLESYQRRYSEVHQRPNTTNTTELDGQFLSTSMMSAYSTSALETAHVVKLDQKGYQRKEPLNSIVATEQSAHSNRTHSAVQPSTPLEFLSDSFAYSHPTFHLNQASIYQLAPSAQPRSHFTFPPSRVSPKHEAHSVRPVGKNIIYSTPESSVPQLVHSSKSKKLSRNYKPGALARSLHSMVSKRFRSAVSTKNEEVEPFEFSPITLITSTTPVRQTKVLRNVPVVQRSLSRQSSYDSSSSIYSSACNPLSSISASTAISTKAEITEGTETNSGENNSERLPIPPVISRSMLKATSDPELASPKTLTGEIEGNMFHSIPETSLSPSPPLHPRHLSSPSYIAFQSALSFSTEDCTKFKTLQNRKLHPKRHSSLKNRRTKSTNVSPRRGSIKFWQDSLNKVTARSITSLTTSPTRKLPRPFYRKLKRTSSLQEKQRPRSTPTDVAALKHSSTSLFWFLVRLCMICTSAVA